MTRVGPLPEARNVRNVTVPFSTKNTRSLDSSMDPVEHSMGRPGFSADFDVLGLTPRFRGRLDTTTL